MRIGLTPLMFIFLCAWIGATVAADSVTQGGLGPSASATVDEVGRTYDEMEKALEQQFSSRIARARQAAADSRLSPAQRTAAAEQIPLLEKDREKSLAALKKERAEALADAKAARR